MAATTNKAHLFIGTSELLNPKAHVDGPEYLFEFDESEVWPTNNDVIFTAQLERKSNNNKVARPSRKPKPAEDHRPTGPKSLPVSIPDWSKIRRGGEYRRHGGFDAYEDEDDDGGDVEDFDGNDVIIPPHEYLARNRTSSFYVHEGAGRTLKGVDLSRVRNAISKQIGFED